MDLVQWRCSKRAKGAGQAGEGTVGAPRLTSTLANVKANAIRGWLVAGLLAQCSQRLWFQQGLTIGSWSDIELDSLV